MDKKLFLLAGVGILLSGMKRTPTVPPKNESGGGTTGGGPAPGTAAPDPIGGAIKGAAGSALSAAAAAAIAAIKGALGTGGAAAGGGTAIATTTASTTHVTAGGATSGGSAGGAIAGGVVASAASIAIAVVVVVIVIIAIIVFSIFGANIPLKTAIDLMARNGAIDLFKFELELFSKIRESVGMNGGFQQVDVQDPRMNGASLGTLAAIVNHAPLNVTGSRATFAYRPAPGTKPEWMGGDSPSVAILRMFKQIRALSLEYLSFRARLLDSMGNGFYPDINPPGFATNKIGGGFSAIQWGTGSSPPADWGGFDQLPLLDGQTLYSINHPEVANLGRPSGSVASSSGPREWFVARDATPDTAFLSSPYGEQLLKAARLKALCDVMSLFALDVTVVGLWEDYARFVTGRLHLDTTMITFRAKSAAEPWNGWTFFTNSSFFGTTVAFDVWMIRVPSGNSRMFKRNAGVPLGDKRLGTTWID